MKTTTAEKENREGSSTRKPARSRFSNLPWGYMLLAAVPVGLSAFYLNQVAPGLVPMPEGMKVPFPALTKALEPFCVWCGKNPEWVFGIAASLLLAGLLCRINYAKYYTTLAVAAALSLAIVWYLISAPVDRLIKNVEDNIPRDSRVSDPLKH